jgi:hypothetical protein
MAPAFCVCDGEMVMTLNMPAMKAYLARKDHRSLAALPGVAAALNDPHPPAVLGYCDTPRVFEILYPLCSMYGILGAAEAEKEKVDLDLTFWPSAAAIRSHLRPDVATLERTPHGLRLTSRYSLPLGGATGPLALMTEGSLAYTALVAYFYRGDPPPSALPVPPPGNNATPTPYGAYPSPAPAAKTDTSAPESKKQEEGALPSR